MLVWVGTDVAGNTLVVWEAEASPIAQDPIAALGVGRRQDQSPGRDSPHSHPHHPFPLWAGSELRIPLEDLILKETFQITDAA